MERRIFVSGGLLSCLIATGCSGPVEAYHPVAESSAQQPAAEQKVASTQSSVEITTTQTTTVQKPAIPAGDTTLPPVEPALGNAAAPGESLESLKVELKVPEKDFQKEGSEQALRVSFDDIDLLRVLNMEPVPTDATKYFPGWLSGLDGQKVRLRGWMFPPTQEDGLPGFLFVRDNQICCFGRQAKVYDKVGVSLKDGVTSSYIQGHPFDVIGTLKIQPEVEDGELTFLYFIEDAVVVDG
jgi:hypothetical protein